MNHYKRVSLMLQVSQIKIVCLPVFSSHFRCQIKSINKRSTLAYLNILPIGLGSMYGILTHVYHHLPWKSTMKNVCKYTSLQNPMDFCWDIFNQMQKKPHDPRGPSKRITEPHRLYIKLGGGNSNIFHPENWGNDPI